VGVSVSRVGGAAHPKAMKKVAGSLRINLAQFRELEAFAAFGSDLDAASKAQLARGSRLVELLKQPQYEPYAMEEEVVSVWAGTAGEIDEVPLSDVRRFDKDFLDYLHRERAELLTTIHDTGLLSDETVASLQEAIQEFKQQFRTSEGTLLGHEAEVDPLDEDDVEKATITKKVRKG